MSWTNAEFRDVATVVTGTTPKKLEENYGSDVPFVTPGDLGSHAEIGNTKTMLTRKGAETARELPAGSVLVCCIGATIGKVGIASMPIVTNQQINSLIFDESKVFPKYGYYFCLTLKKKLRDRSSSTTMPIVNKTSFSGIKIPLPPLETQKRIATILDKADKLGGKRQQAIKLADEFLRAVFLDMYGDPITNNKEWPEHPIREGLRFIDAGWSARGNNYPADDKCLGVLKISSVTSGIFRPEENKAVDPESVPESKTLIFPQKGDLLFSRANTRDLVAATCIVQENYSNLFLPDKLWKIRTDKEKLLPEFLLFLMGSPGFRRKLTGAATGTSGSMLNISKVKLESTIAIFPDIKTQKEFSDIYWKVQEHRRKTNKSSEFVKYLFSSASQKAFSGEL